MDDQNVIKKYPLIGKLAITATLILLLTIPQALIENLMHERAERQDETVLEVSSKWGGKQKLIGPILTVPYSTETETIVKKGDKDSLVYVTENGNGYFLPETLDVVTEVYPEIRYRSIYEVVVYNTKMKFSGTFSLKGLSKMKTKFEDYHFDKALITMGISDLRGIQELMTIDFAGVKYKFNSGNEGYTNLGNAINAPVKITIEDAEKDLYAFSFDLLLKGSESLSFVPVGAETNVKMNSSWTSPSFTGMYLPDPRSINEDGFEANWKVLHLNRSFPQYSDYQDFKFQSALFGVDLVLQADTYQKSIRAVKYSMLFIVLTFTIFFFIEVLNKKKIHPFNYILVGFALSLFYLLLISISEQQGFLFAYTAAGAATIILISLYMRAILKSAKLSAFAGAVLLILYSFIYTIIAMQDYSLLIGSLGLFVTLAVTMYISRKIEWNSLKKEE